MKHLSNQPMKQRGFADLHIHTYFSDGTLSPDMVARQAAANGVDLIAVADHNVLAGSRRLMKCCQREGIRCLSAVELDTLEGGSLYHILGYGIDLDDTDFKAFCARSRLLLDLRNETLIERMACDTPGVSLEDYRRFCRNYGLGGWKALQYLLSRGAASTTSGVVALYDKYECRHETADFPSVADACAAVRAAGGKPVLAHPGKSIDTTDLTAFAAMLDQLAASGVAGVECYYPAHSPAITDTCLRFATGRGLLITSGSDCHGQFGRAKIGQMRVALEQLNLGGLI